MLGFRFFRDKIALRKHIILSIKRKVIIISFKFKNHKKIYIREARSLISNLGWLNNCNTLYFYKKYIQPYIKIKKVKEIISYESRKYNSTARIL
jgi:RNA-directed DNA polymerase